MLPTGVGFGLLPSEATCQQGWCETTEHAGPTRYQRHRHNVVVHDRPSLAEPRWSAERSD
jgi:hypothetical protein